MKSLKLKTAGMLMLALAIGTAASHAQVIYSDSLTSSPNGYTSGTGINGSTPDVTDTTGDTVIGYSRGAGDPTFSSSGASLSFNGVGALSTAGTNASGNVIYTLSANLEVNNIGGTDTTGNPQAAPNQGGDSTRGVGLGFESSVPAATLAAGYTGNYTASDAFSAAFSGFVLNSAGTLNFVGNGVSNNGPSLAFAGTFSPTSAYNLSFSVDTATGKLTNVTFNGANVTSTFATAAADFAAASDNYIEFGSSSNAANTTGYVSNLVLSSTAAVPEPSTWALLLGGVGSLALLRRFRNRQA